MYIRHAYSAMSARGERHPEYSLYFHGADAAHRSIPDQGFSLTELIVVLLLSAILVSIAIPTYSEHVIRGRRSDAMTQLLRLHNEQAQFFSANGRYADADEIGLPRATRYYRIELSNGTDTGYFLVATPIAGSSQEGSGPLRISAYGLPQWDKSNDGSFAFLWDDR